MNIWECLKIQIVIAGNKRSRNPTLQVVITYASHRMYVASIHLDFQ